MPNIERSADLDVGRVLDWSEIYGRLLADPSDGQGWIGLQTWVGLWSTRALGRFGPQAIEDVVAETCVSVVTALDKARGAETFAGFVQGHFLNVRQRLLRQQAIPVVGLEGIDRAGKSMDAPEPDELALLRRCLEELPDRERRAVSLRYFGQAPAQDIAGDLGVSVGNARRIVFNGLARLRECARRAWPGGR